MGHNAAQQVHQNVLNGFYFFLIKSESRTMAAIKLVLHSSWKERIKERMLFAICNGGANAVVQCKPHIFLLSCAVIKVVFLPV